MITKYTLKTLLYQIALIVIVSSICLNPDQPDGRCTSCASIQVLFNGSCYPKIRGCLKHVNGTKCSQCQFGYVLNSSTCIREAVFFNRTNLSDIPPVRIFPAQNLTFEDIRAKMGQQYGSFFTDSHEYFVSKYTNELGKGNIRQVQTLQTKTGQIIVIVYQGSSSRRFEAVAKKNLQGRIQQWSFGVAGAQKRDPATADSLIRKALGSRLTGFVVYNVRQQVDIFTFDYMNEKNQIIRVKVNRNDLIQTNIASNLATKLTTTTIQLWDLALEEFKKKYPSYSFSEVTQVRKVDQFYVVSLGDSTSFSFKIENYQLTINKPIDQPVTSYQPNILIGGAQIGNWGEYTDILNNDFQIGINLIAKQFPQTKQARLLRARNQVTSNGINYYIVLRRPIVNSTNFDDYQFLIFLRPNKIAEIIEGRLNGKLIYQKEYNYNTDVVFLNIYRIIAQSKIANIPPISSVTFKQQKNRKYYKVRYSEFQFAQLEYLLDTKLPNLISYFVDGEDVIRKLKGALIQSSQRSPDLLLNFIKNQNPNITVAQIQSVDYKAPTYTVTVVSSSGKYRALITDKGGQLVLNQLNYLSNQTCFDLDLNQQRNQIRVKYLSDFLKQNYPLQFFDVKLAQVRVQASGVPQIRLLFANPQQKQIQIIVQDTNSVLKASYINFAYQTVDPNSQVASYGKILQTISTLKGTKQPLYTEQNGTLYHSFYDDTKSTYEIFYDIKADKVRSQVINTRPYLLLPEGFSFTGLLTPGGATDAEQRILNNIVREAVAKFSVTLINSTLAFANKINNTYNLMFKNSFGYQQLSLNVTNNIISFGKLILTTYKDSDFSNCRNFDSTGKCLSCNQTTQVQYQGYCFQRIEGCNVQPGKICVKCSIPYVRSNFKCFKQCFNFFR